MEKKSSKGTELIDAKVSYLVTWKAMETFIYLKLVKSIGISNFNIDQVENVLRVAHIKPVVNQVIIIFY